MKNAIVIFSAEGNTRHVSEELSKIIGGPILEIKPTIPYSHEDLDWHDRHSRSSVEMQDEHSRPEISPLDITGYDRLFIGFPIWWGIAPRVIQTFLESGEFAGKTVVPFCTSGGSGVGKTDEVLHKCCSAQTKWKPCKRLSAAISPRELGAYVASLKL